MEKEETLRRLEYDLLRILACIMVVMLHVSAFYWTKLSPQTTDWKVLNFYDSIVRSCVPLFFMISGVFMLHQEMSLTKLWRKHILHLVLVWMIWSVLYGIDTLGFSGFFHSGTGKIFTAVVNGKYHLWFLPAMIGVYILAPFLYGLIRLNKEKWIQYGIALFFLFGVVRSTLTVYPYSNSSIFDFINKMPDFRNYAGYFLLGYALEYLFHKKVKTFWLMLGYIFTAGAAVGISQVDSIAKGTPTGLMFGYFCLPVFVEAVCIFLIFKNMGDKLHIRSQTGEKMICLLSKCTMGVYLLHPFVLERLDRLHINALMGNPVLFVPLVTVLTVGICGAINFVLLQVPIVKKYLF